MAGDEEEISKKYFLNEQTDEAKIKFLCGAKVYPNYTDNDTEQNMYSIIANNTFQMRLRVLNMEKNILQTYFAKQIIDNDKDTRTKIQYLASTVLGINHPERTDDELFQAENLSTELMRKIKEVLYRKAAKKEDVQENKNDIKVLDYRSIVTVRGTKEDVTNCIIKATDALENGKYDRAESLLLKAERMFPTKNARDLLKQVRAAKELKQHPELTEKTTKSVEQACILKNEELVSEMDSVNANKCLSAFETSFVAGNFVKAERLLHKAKRFKPSLDVEENISRVKAAMVTNTMEEKTKNILEEANREHQAVGEYNYKSIKTYNPDESTRVERNSNSLKTFNLSLELEPHLSKYSPVIASKNSTEEKSKISRHDQPMTNITFEDKVYILGKSKNNTNIQTKNDADRDNSNKYDRKETPNKNKLLDGGYFERINLEESNFFSKNNADSNSIKSTPNNHVKGYVYMAENTINCNTIEFGNSTKTVEIEKTDNEHFNKHLQYEEMNEYNKCIKLVSKYTAEGNLTKAERFLNKAVRINPNNADKAQLKSIQDTIASQTSNGITDTTKTVKSEKDLQREKEAKILAHPPFKAENDNDSKYDKKETSNKNKLLNGGYFERINLEESYFSSKNDADSNSIKSTPKNHVEYYVQITENAIKDKKFNDITNFPNTAEELRPTPQAKEHFKNISDIRFSRDGNVYSNCYKGPVEANESNKLEASKCIEIAKATFEKGEYDRAEYFLLKSQKSCDNQTVQSNLELVREAKAQNNTNVTVKTQKNDNEYFNKHLQYEEMNEYNKCIKLVSKYMAEGNLTKAEHFLKKAVRINPNDAAKAQLKSIQDTMASQTSNGMTVTSKTIKSEKDLKREKEAKIWAHSAFKAKNDNDSKYDKKETSNNNKLLNSGYFERINLEESNFSIKNNADSNSIKSTPKNQVEDYVQMAENAIKDKKFNDTTNFPNTAEKLKPTPQAKEHLKNISDIPLLRDGNVYSNCYKDLIEANKSNKTEASKCIEIGKAAFQKGEYGRTEHFLKSQKICDNQTVQSNLELLREAKAQNNTNVTVKTEETGNEHFNKHLQHKEINEYNNCIKLVSRYIAEGNLSKAERFLNKAVRINPNDADKAQLKSLQNTIASQTWNGVAVTSKAIKSEKDLKRETEAEIFTHLAFKAKKDKNIGAARYYLERALQKQTNEKTRKQLENLKVEIERQKRRHPFDIKLEANKLLNQVLLCIRNGDIEKAESFLIISWNMNKTRRTIPVYKTFLDERMIIYSRKMENRRNERNYEKLENIFRSDELVMLALDNYEIKQIKKAQELLMRASKLHPSTQIEKLLNEIETKPTHLRSSQACCTIT